MMGNTQIEVYPVGIMRDLRNLRNKLRHPGFGMTRRQELRASAGWFVRSWRRRSYWNGYLAEIHYPPAGLVHRRAGKGWTRKAAARSLGFRLWEDNRR